MCRLQHADRGSTCRGGNTTLLKPDFQVPKKGATEPSSGSGSGSGSDGGSGGSGGGGDDSSEPDQPGQNPRCAGCLLFGDMAEAICICTSSTDLRPWGQTATSCDVSVR